MSLPFDRLVIGLLVIASLFLAAQAWLHDHPQHNPWAPLRIEDPWGWATGRKIAQLRADGQECRAFLTRSDIAFEDLPTAGEGECLRSDRIVLGPDRQTGLAFSPSAPQASCTVLAGLALWLRHGVQPAAESILNSRVVSIQHFGTYSCRRVGGGGTGRWSEHSTGNAIDVSGFVLEDGRRIDVRRDWSRQDDIAQFLRGSREAACDVFGTVLSPDYNAAHADHFHLDQAQRGPGWSYCR